MPYLILPLPTHPFITKQRQRITDSHTVRSAILAIDEVLDDFC